MKTILLTGFMAICIAAGAQTKQANPAIKKFSFSLEVGGNLSTISGENALSFFTPSKTKAGVNAGFNVQWAFTKQLALQGGVSYITKGTGKGVDNLNGLNEPQPIDYFVIKYLSIPLNIIYTPGTNGRFFTGAGLYYAPALSARQQLTQNGSRTVILSSREDNKGMIAYPWAIKKADAGINLLAGYNISHHFYGKINAQWGLKNICTPFEGLITNEGGHYKTSAYILSLGYQL